MQREIKFRAWDKEKKVMGIISSIDFKPKTVWFRWYVSDTRQGHYILMWDEFELMQFTGLKDKNGREIYEGDIVEYFDTLFSPREVFVVGFVNGMFYLKSTEDDEYNAGLNNIAPLSIIGNIYENPELLTKD